MDDEKPQKPRKSSTSETVVELGDDGIERVSLPCPKCREILTTPFGVETICGKCRLRITPKRSAQKERGPIDIDRFLYDHIDELCSAVVAVRDDGAPVGEYIFAVVDTSDAAGDYFARSCGGVGPFDYARFISAVPEERLLPALLAMSPTMGEAATKRPSTGSVRLLAASGGKVTVVTMAIDKLLDTGPRGNA
jgi:hypothetical protein